MFNVYGEIPQAVYSIHDTLQELDSTRGNERKQLAHFLRLQGGYKGSDEIVLERYRLALRKNLQ